MEIINFCCICHHFRWRPWNSCEFWNFTAALEGCTLRFKVHAIPTHVLTWAIIWEMFVKLWRGGPEENSPLAREELISSFDAVRCAMPMWTESPNDSWPYAPCGRVGSSMKRTLLKQVQSASNNLPDWSNAQQCSGVRCALGDHPTQSLDSLFPFPQTGARVQRLGWWGRGTSTASGSSVHEDQKQNQIIIIIKHFAPKCPQNVCWQTFRSFTESGIPVDVVAAVDINSQANHIYKHNFPETPLMQKSIEVREHFSNFTGLCLGRVFVFAQWLPWIFTVFTTFESSRAWFQLLPRQSESKIISYQ